MADLEEKERIINQAQEKFFSHGFSKVTVDEIAADLGMSKKTIYKFFPSKEEILRAVAQMMMERVEREVSKIVSSDKRFEQKMTELLTFIGSFLGRIGRQLSLDMKKYAPELWKEIEAFRHEHVLTKIQMMFRQAKHEGVLRSDVNTEVLMLMFISSVEGIVTPDTLSKHSFSAAEAFQSIFKILFEGSLTEESRKNMHFVELTSSSTL